MEVITQEEVSQEIAFDQVESMKELSDLDLALIGGGNGVVVFA